MLQHRAVKSNPPSKRKIYGQTEPLPCLLPATPALTSPPSTNFAARDARTSSIYRAQIVRTVPGKEGKIEDGKTLAGNGSALPASQFY